MGSYNVAFRYTKRAGGYHGVVTWTTFPSKEYFDKWYTDDIRETQAVVEEGISQERCIELVSDVPMACRIAAATQDATDSDGVINKEILMMNLANAAIIDRFE